MTNFTAPKGLNVKGTNLYVIPVKSKKGSEFIKCRAQYKDAEGNSYGMPVATINVWGLSLETRLDLYEWAEENPGCLVEIRGVLSSIPSVDTPGEFLHSLRDAFIPKKNGEWITKELSEDDFDFSQGPAMPSKEAIERRSQRTFSWKEAEARRQEAEAKRQSFTQAIVQNSLADEAAAAAEMGN